MSLDISTGITVTFASGLVLEGRSLEWDGIERDAHDSSNFATVDWRTFEPGGLVDPGEMTIGINFQPATTPPHLAVAETVTVTFTNTDLSTWAASGFLRSWAVATAEEDAPVTATLVIKLSGAITVTI